MRSDDHSNTLGWREWTSFPEHGIPWIKAKIDTGARTSALHAFGVEESADGSTVSFTVQPWQGTDGDAVRVELPVHDRRVVRSSSGHTEERLVVLMRIELAGQPVMAEVTLTNRDAMGFRMLIGREALHGFLVDPAASFLGGRAPRAIRRRNRGR